MSISAECVLRDGATARLRAMPYHHPGAQDLIGRVQQEYVERYGGPDAAEVDPAEFDPPAGVFLVAEVDGEPVGCGAWRAVRPGMAEVKRLYVAPGHRRRGIARVVLDALESSATREGHRTVVLNTGDRQPEAIALYERAGYGPVPGYGIYACAPGAVFLGKELPEPADDEAGESPWAS
jgi:GNAT superfamily N-acetyltransferase